MGLLTADQDLTALSMALLAARNPLLGGDRLSAISQLLAVAPPTPEPQAPNMLLAAMGMGAISELFARDPAAPSPGGPGRLGRPYQPAPPPVPDWFALNMFFAPPKRRVFTSFQMEDHWAVQLLREIKASPDFDLEFYDESIQEPFDSVNADYIRRQLRERIARTSVTICLVGATTYESKWVDFELFESFKKGSRVIGMGLPGGSTSLTYPRFFDQSCAPVKLWNPALLRTLITTAPEPRAFE